MAGECPVAPLYSALSLGWSCYKTILSKSEKTTQNAGRGQSGEGPQERQAGCRPHDTYLAFNSHF